MAKKARLPGQKPPNECRLCGNTVSKENLEIYGPWCHLHRRPPGSGGKAGSGMPTLSQSLQPKYLEETYPELMFMHDSDKGVAAQRQSMRVNSNIYSGYESYFGKEESRAVESAYGKWSMGKDMSIPANARRRMERGPEEFYRLMVRELRGKKRRSDLDGVYLLNCKGLKIRARHKADLFQPAEFGDMSHKVVGVYTNKFLYVVDPLVSAFAPVGPASDKKSRANIPVSQSAALRGTPFDSPPLVAPFDVYQDLDMNGWMGWGSITLLKKPKERRSNERRKRPTGR